MDVQTIQEHAGRGSQWLVDHQSPDGSWTTLREQESDGTWTPLEVQEVDAFYKGAWALTTTGEHAAAHRLLDYVGEQHVTRAGDLAPRKNEPFHDGCPLYPNAYVVIGSMAAGRYEIATPTTRYLLSRQDPTSGGFYSQRGVPGDESRTNVWSTSSAGIACLAAGRLEPALEAGEYLHDLVDRQPEIDERFYTTIDADGSLNTDIETEQDAWMRVVELDEPDQYWGSHMGLPLAFLVLLAEASGSERHDRLARWFLDYQKRGVDPWSVSSSGKAAWATSTMYRITGDEAYRELALRITEDVIVACQNDDGSFEHPAMNPYDSNDDAVGADRSEYHHHYYFDIGAEFTLWLGLIAANLAARDGR